MSKKLPVAFHKPMTYYQLRLAVEAGYGAEIYKSLEWMRKHGGDPAHMENCERALKLAPGEKA